ncbi:uncharacterized protein LOC121858375 [Homarus americanus]|uniref:uncharacterized protein LOC121858375 n=1 Tax=Homarus americanus TaxID=6706 RepID=UPI001C456C2F|nr:uncharacterized protein LOC121858375 [Homarus americanus]
MLLVGPETDAGLPDTMLLYTAHADTTVQHELSVPLADSVFWTDSMMVLKYIGNAGKRFHTFVAKKVLAIREVTDMKQWRHVSSEQNPVDDATRGVTSSQILENCRWTQGPRFIRLPPEYWSKGPQVDMELKGDREVKGDVTSLTSIVNRTKEPLQCLWERYSFWLQLQRGVAWIRSVINVLKDKTPTTNITVLSVAELRHAKTAIFRVMQRERYQQEMRLIAKKRLTHV